ncbi:MAG: LacI family DNA-binding transcriptional regulator [Oscillospiraceae bacterium]|nr:LacI family DNA-binding transcriptional regulator [Oscillospiraceae bacterium]
MSLKEIADIAGVSPSTASRVLNNPNSTCASEAVRQRIFDAVRTTGYVPSSAARALKRGVSASGDSPLISLVFARIASPDADPFFSELARHVESELLGAGFRLGERIFAEGDALKVSEADGFVILGRCSDALLRRISANTQNLVGLWRNPAHFSIDEVVCDGKIAAVKAVNHLLSLGHRNIAYIGDCSSEVRYLGYCETLIGSHIPINYPLIIEVPHTRESGRSAMESLLASGKATAVFCASDSLAFGALDAIKHHRISKKADMSVISIDDVSGAEAARLTTIHIPQHDMAHLAVRLLADRISGGHYECARIEFSCRLIERDTCFYSAG